MDQFEVLKKALNRYGPDSQINIAIEEMAELTKELCKYLRGEGDRPHMVEEIADVLITIQQLITMFSNDDEIENWCETKITRLAEKMKREESWHGA